MNQPAAIINLEVYEDSVNLLGVAKVTLPSITYPTVSISGAGMMGNMEVPLLGMVDAMTTSIEFLDASNAQAAVLLSEPRKHQLEMRVAMEHWNVEQAEVGSWADRYLMVCHPKVFNPGTFAPMSAAGASNEFAVYYYAGFRDGKQLWEIDKRSMKCIINGVDYMASVRKALGK